MRKYYLFHVKRDIYELYSKDGYMLYQTLESIYHLKDTNLNYGISLFEQLCIPFNVRIINTFFKKKYLKEKSHNYIFINDYLKEKTIVKLGSSRIIVKSNVNLPEILNVLEFYNPRLFVCDFENHDFFWLSNYDNIYEYI